MYGARDFQHRCSTTSSSSIEQRLVKDRHLKLVVDLDGRKFDAIWFSRTEQVPRTVRLAYRPVVDDYMGERRLQLVIEYAAL